MSMDNPEQFDYLKVVEFDRGVPSLKNNHKNYYPLTCVVRNSVKENYSDNSEYSLSFDIWNDGSEGFKALHEGSWVLAGEQLFVIQTYTKRVKGVASASITATQIVNAYFQRVMHVTPFKSVSSEGGTENANKVVYTDLRSLLHWFWDGIDTLGFQFYIHGYFPKRPLKNVGHWNGKQLLTNVLEAWPGTVVVPHQGALHFYGYQEKRDKNGDLQNIRNIDTELRFDQFYDTADIEITRDASRLCNAIEVKSSTYSTTPSADDSDDGESSGENEFVQTQQPYFKNFMAVSKKSIEKYGLYVSPDVLDDGFTRADAALQAAREKMVLEPQITVKAVIDHPGRTEKQPIAGYKYTVGVGAENEVFHVILRGYEWYPFDPQKGVTMTLANVDPGIVDNLKATIVHDMELSPTVTNFKMLQDDNNDDNLDIDDSQPGDGDETGTGDTGLKQVDSDAGDDRPDDPGDSRSNQNPPVTVQANLPIWDKPMKEAYISKYGGLTFNKNIGNWQGRVTDTEHIQKLAKGQYNKNEFGNDVWKWLFRYNWQGHGGTYNSANDVNTYYHSADVYQGQWYFGGSGMIGTPNRTITVVGGIGNGDYNSDGTLIHRPDHWTTKNGKRTAIYDDWKNHPGRLATLQLGGITASRSIYTKGDIGAQGRITAAKSVNQYGSVTVSELSKKKNIHRVTKDEGLNTIKDLDIGSYVYKNDKNEDPQASVMIDDVHKVSQWNTSDKILSKDGKYRNDSALLGYTVKAVQKLNDKIDELSNRVDTLEKENKQLKDQLDNKS